MASTIARQMLQYAPRDVGSEINGVKTTFSSWDNCMAQAYCKWPVVIAIIIASLIVISLLTCLFRCLCCGVECCCACFSCCNACCPSPRKRRRNDDYSSGGGYSQAPPQSSVWAAYEAQKQGKMQYGPGGGGYQNVNAQAIPSLPRTATFDAPSRKANVSSPTSPYHEDSLPAMPSWDSAREKRITMTAEERALEEQQAANADEVEMTPIASSRPAAGVAGMEERRQQYQQTQGLLNSTEREYASGNMGAGGYSRDNHVYAQSHGGMSTPSDMPISGRSFAPTNEYGMVAAGAGVGAAVAMPYHDYNAHQQFVPSPYGSQSTSTYPPTYHTQEQAQSPTSEIPSPTYGGGSGAQGYGYAGGYGQNYGQSQQRRPLRQQQRDPYGGERSYTPSIVPPSYRSQAASPTSPGPVRYAGGWEEQQPLSQSQPQYSQSQQYLAQPAKYAPSPTDGQQPQYSGHGQHEQAQFPDPTAYVPDQQLPPQPPPQPLQHPQILQPQSPQVQMLAQAPAPVTRRPVQGSWRDV